MSDLVGRLLNNASLLREAADRIAHLEAEVERLGEALRGIRKVSRSNHLPLGMTIRTLAHTVHRMADKALKARTALAEEGDTST